MSFNTLVQGYNSPFSIKRRRLKLEEEKKAEKKVEKKEKIKLSPEQLSRKAAHEMKVIKFLAGGK